MLRHKGMAGAGVNGQSHILAHVALPLALFGLSGFGNFSFGPPHAEPKATATRRRGAVKFVRDPHPGFSGIYDFQRQARRHLCDRLGPEPSIAAEFPAGRE